MRLTDSQAECVENTYGVPSAVSAGAGSGKTATLTARIVYALQHPEVSGVEDIDRVLIITYTNKAADELKSRIKGALEEAGLIEQALKVDGAWISTIHGMCSRILKENAFTFGVDPAFEILSDEVRSKLLDEAIEEALTSASGDGQAHRIASLLGEYRRDTVKETVARLVEGAAEFNGPLQDYYVLPQAEDPFACLFDLVRMSIEFHDRCAGKGKVAEEHYADSDAALRELLGVGDGALDEDAALCWYESLDKSEPEEALALAARLAKPSGNFPKAIKDEPLSGTEGNPIISLLRRAMDLRLSVVRPHLDTLVEVASEVSLRFDDMKHELGSMDNNDLIGSTVRALQDERNRAITQRYNEQFQLVMVDEFQDTNQVQVDMINLIAGGREGQLSDKLCVVGDAQQSIYRFRNADLAVFRNHVAHVADKRADGTRGKVISFQKNFRSHAEILAFSKEVFQRTFDEGTYLELLHGRDEDAASKKCPFRGAVDETTTDVPHRVNVNVITDLGVSGMAAPAAQAIARDFARLAEKGHRPGEMAVLLGSMTHAEEYARALHDHGLSCAVTGGSVFKKTREAKLAISLCYALVNPNDAAHLAAVLTSDLFCLSAEDLLLMTDGFDGASMLGTASLARAFMAVASAQVTIGDLQARGWSAQAVNAVSVLYRAMQDVGSHPLHKIVEDVLVNSGWIAREQGLGTVRAGNMLKAVRILAEVEQDGSLDGLALARRFEAHIDEVKEPPGVLSAKGDDFVRIMTIHASKGLQFPIVAVSEAGFSFKDNGKLKMTTLDGHAYLSLDSGASVEPYKSKTLFDASTDQRNAMMQDYDTAHCARMVKTPRFASDAMLGIRAINEAAEHEEHQRKLYVAFTRAEDALIVALKEPSSQSKKKNNRFENDAHSAIEEVFAAEGRFTVESGERETTLTSLSTTYEGEASHTLEWAARVTVESAKKTPADGDPSKGQDESESRPPDHSSDVSDANGGTERLVPASAIEFSLDDAPYRAFWAQGYLSASSIAHSGEHEPAGQYASQQAPSIAFDDEGGEPSAPATERGTAFHALGEWACNHRLDDGSLPRPPEERFAAIARFFQLNTRQVGELEGAFQRWLESDAAKRAQSHKTLSAEESFFVELSPASQSRNALVLQGFIDMLAYDEFASGCAYVVDYKTGLHLETDEQRRKAYEAQAKTYAFALLLQGFDDVRLDFVFVDQADPQNPDAASITSFPSPDEPPYTLDALRADLVTAVEGTAGT